VAIAATLALAPPTALAQASETGSPPSVPARAWILLDAHDRHRLAANDPAASLAMASATKLMTAYLALRELAADRLLTAPPYEALPAESLLGLRAGERISVRDLLYGLLLASGNDAAVTLADGVAGSVPAFVGDMNSAARRLGLNATRYSNPIGLDEAGNYSSPRDLAALALRLRREPIFRRIVDTPRTTLRSGSRPRTITNRNDLVLDVPWVNGVKTGYTLDAGYVLVGSGTRKGVTLVSVVMGASSSAARDDATLALLRYGFSLYKRRMAVERGERLAYPEVPNAEERLPLVAARSLRVTARRDQRVDVSTDVTAVLEAPIRRGERVGSAAVTLDGERAGRVALVAARAASVAEDDSLIAGIDDSLPGPRAVAWTLIGAALAAILVLIGLFTRRRPGG
jgi:D-alanyl-D-alanine carboxypeptidase (penicillin-binding protein 5/6)